MALAMGFGSAVFSTEAGMEARLKMSSSVEKPYKTRKNRHKFAFRVEHF